MSHNSSKDKWNQLTQKQRETIWRQQHGTSLVPDNLSGTALDNLLRNVNYEKKDETTRRWDSPDDSSWGAIPD